MLLAALARFRLESGAEQAADLECVGQLAAGDGAALARLYERHGTPTPAELLAEERPRGGPAALPPPPLMQRMPLELAYKEGLSRRKTAERLEQPLGTVKTRFRLGLVKLRAALSEEHA